jgi:hypothetical protein
MSFEAVIRLFLSERYQLIFCTLFARIKKLLVDHNKLNDLYNHSNDLVGEPNLVLENVVKKSVDHSAHCSIKVSIIAN